MKKIKIGDIVTRKSYGKDIMFKVIRIIQLKNNHKIAILKGITVRVEADADLDDLCIIEKKEIKKRLKILDDRILNQIEENKDNNNRKRSYVQTGRILHLDGDKRYSEKSRRYYKKMGLNAIVKNINENKQPCVIYKLLKYYKPDILVITGHDGMIKKEVGYNDIYNYRNSKYFIETVKEARRYEREYRRNIAIFARSMSKLL